MINGEISGRNCLSCGVTHSMDFVVSYLKRTLELLRHVDTELLEIMSKLQIAPDKEIYHFILITKRK